MPRLDDHGLGGGGKSLGVPVYPLNNVWGYVKDDVNGTFQNPQHGTTTTAPLNIVSSKLGCTIGDHMYLLGLGSTNQTCYKYNVKTKAWTKLADKPITGAGWAVPVGMDIYYNAGTEIYKYDTVNNTHSRMGSSKDGSGATATTDGEYIYVFGGNAQSSYYTIAYKYSLSNFTETSLKSLSVSRYYCKSAIKDGYVYIFGGMSTASTSAIRYSIANNTYEDLTKIPFGYANGMIEQFDNYICLMNSSQSGYYNQVHIYDINNNIYTRLTNTTNNRYNGQSGLVDRICYMIGGGADASLYISGESMMLLRARVADLTKLNLPKNTKVRTDGDVVFGEVSDVGGSMVIMDGTILNKTNGVVNIPNTGECAIVDANYATIGG